MTAEGYRMKNSSHPGRFLHAEMIEAHGLSVAEAAAALGVSVPALSAVLTAEAPLTTDMALRAEKAFGASMDTLMRMQCSYDVAQARRREDEIDVQRYVSKASDSERIIPL